MDRPPTASILSHVLGFLEPLERPNATDGGLARRVDSAVTGHRLDATTAALQRLGPRRRPRTHRARRSAPYARAPPSGVTRGDAKDTPAPTGPAERSAPDAPCAAQQPPTPAGHAGGQQRGNTEA